MKGELEGQSGLVVGADRGIGAAVLAALARNGARVVAAARSEANLAETVQTVRGHGGWAEAVVVDVGDPASVDEMVGATVDLVGNIKILVNSAGLFEPKPFLAYTDHDWQRHIEINLFGPVRVSRAVLPMMLEAGYGRIINVASTAGKYGSMGQSAYNAAKHAVVGLTKCLALEVAARGVTVNAVCPGFVNTQLLDRDDFRAQHGIASHDDLEEVLSKRVPTGRLVRAEEIAELCLYLCMPQTTSMTGQALTIAGGMLLI